MNCNDPRRRKSLSFIWLGPESNWRASADESPEGGFARRGISSYRRFSTGNGSVQGVKIGLLDGHSRVEWG